MHGANQRVSIEKVRRGLRILLGAVLDVSAKAPRPEATAP